MKTKEFNLSEKKMEWVKLICKCGHNKLYHYDGNLVEEHYCMGICNCKKFKLAGDLSYDGCEESESEPYSY